MEDPKHTPAQPEQAKQQPASPASEDKAANDLWHEPPVPAGSSRPVIVETWFTPPDAVAPAEASSPEDNMVRAEADSPTKTPSETAPAPVTDWHTPLDAQAEALLAGVDETIPEVPAAESAETPPAPDATRQQVESDTSQQAAAEKENVVAPEAASTESQAVAAESAAPAKTPAVPSADAQRFEQVEQQVKALRERYQAGEISREQLQNELRSLMILDDQGRWWMLGLESNRWYYYNGQSWVAATPPGYEQRIRGSAVRTETGVQQVVVESAAGLAGEEATLDAPKEEGAEDSVPLPQRVPLEDPGATLVSPNTPFLEPVRRSEAPTLPKSREVDAAAANVITHPRGPLGADQQTLVRGRPHEPDVTIARGGLGTAAAEVRAIRETVPPPKPPLGGFPQPDYSAALGTARNRNTYVRWAIRFSVFGIIGSMALTLVILLLIIGYYLYKVDQYAEAVDSLRTRASDFETTLILNAQGATLAEFNNPNTGLRKEVSLDQISPWLIHATISTENETFYSDPGFSVLAMVRAAVQNLRAGNTISGASTITQQLARALVLETEFAYQRTAERKLVEVIVASEIRRKYTKNEILEIYLNEIFYGNFAYGIEAAAQTYFDKPASELNPVEAAFLAGLPQSPATYDPVVNREAAIQRMHTVLRLMSEANGTGCIAIQHDDTTTWGVPRGGSLCIIARPQPDGSVLYYYTTPNTPEPQELTLELALVETKTFTPPSNEFIHPHFVNYVWQQLEETYGPQAIYSAGYRVYTTLDENIQTIAERAVARQLSELQARGINATNASVVVINPKNGAVLAMVGSADYRNEQIDGQVNIAFTAQQPGSAIKPFVYLTAFLPDEQGRYLTPASVLWDVRTDFGNNYIPVNYDRLYHGPKTVREALSNSLNVPAVKVLQFAGLLRFTELATRFGIKFPLGNPVERNAGLPTALGAVEVRLFDLVAAYAALANNGARIEPFSIVYIEDSKGNEIYRATAQTGTQIVPPEYAYLITSILSDGAARAEEFGRGWPLELQGGRPAAVKTGTSNDSRDVWTVGYTPQLTVGVWVGNSDNTPMTGLTGYYGAAPIWNEIMEAAHAGLAIESFSPPPGVMQAEVCRDSGTLPSPQCAGRTYVEIFASSAPPPGPDKDIYRLVTVDTYTQKLANEACASEAEAKVFLVLDDPWAYDWLNNDPAGQAWLAQRSLQPPVGLPPTEYCAPGEPRPSVTVSAPLQDSTVQGVVQVIGSVSMPNFSRYEIRYGLGHTPTAFSEPLLVEQIERREPNALLGQLDTTVLQNGPYTVRLIVYDQFGRFVKRDIRINVNNPMLPPVPVPTFAPTLTPADASSLGPD
ncbi:MAG: transglycosylase domain-containing protein [Aggregatilineaceae bacterium]